MNRIKTFKQFEGLRFSDGIDIDTSGELRKLELHDGMYIVGQGLLIPVKDQEEFDKLMKQLKRETADNDEVN